MHFENILYECIGETMTEKTAFTKFPIKVRDIENGS